MKHLTLILLFIISTIKAFSQNEKPVVDTSIFGKWPIVSLPTLSNDGKYVLYTVHNIPESNCTLFVQSTSSEWKMQYIGVTNAAFTTNSKLLIFKTVGDSLAMLTLGIDNIIYIPNIAEYKLPENDIGEWLAYRIKSPAKELVLHNLITHNEKRFSAVMDYLFNQQGSVLLLQTELTKDTGSIHFLKWINLPDFNIQEIWEGKKVNYISFDALGKQLIFMVTLEIDSVQDNKLWYYQEGMRKAVLRVHNHMPGIDSGVMIANFPPQFNPAGNQVFFKLQSIETGKNKKVNDIQIDVWNYTDTRVQSLQLIEKNRRMLYAAVINDKEKKVIRLEQQDEKMFGFNPKENNYFTLLNHGSGESMEFYWNKASQPSVYLLSTKDGARKLLKTRLKTDASYLALSPEGKWAIYYDPVQKNYFSYETTKGITRNITKSISTVWVKEESKDRPGLSISSLTWSPTQKTWLANDSLVFIYDNYDIWQVDPSCLHPPINITNRYGRAHNIQFRILYEESEVLTSSMKNKSALLLRAFNKQNKENGFYSIQLGTIRDPQFRTMGPFVYYWPDIGFDDFLPQKAKFADTYIVRRMSATEYPNYFVSRDFKKYYALTTFQPQKKYNWLTTELVRWKTLDSSYSTGVLYKPENLDPTKKYPIIFDLYEKRSNDLNVFRWPNSSEDRINIPWFVSHEYLVFTPDIHYKVGEIGKSTVNSVVSAASYLSKIPWVDGKKMGIQGHSFGGYETNYLVTHTTIFAAACSASGISDLTNLYGTSLEELGRTNFFMFWSELGQGRMNASLWQRPDLYIKNSPIFFANKVTTPLLLMGNKHDINVPFSQSLEFFMDLRRLGKKVWMLQYDRGDHSVTGKDAIDYTIRMTQFFDHYLKASPSPKWMTSGIPAKMKGIELGYQLDKNN